MDVIGVLSILPFLKLLSDPSIVNDNQVINYVYYLFVSVLKIDDGDFTQFFGYMVMGLLLASSLIKVTTLKFQLTYAANLEYRLSRSLFTALLNKPYIYHKKIGGTDIAKSVLADVAIVISSNTLPLLTAISQFMLSILLLALLVLVDPFVSFFSGVFLSLMYVSIFILLRKRLAIIADQRFLANEDRYRDCIQAFTGIKTVKSFNIQPYVTENFSSSAYKYSTLQAFSQFFSQVPKLIVEAITFGGLILIVLFLEKEQGSFQDALPVVTLFAIAGYKLLPSMQQIYKSISNIKVSMPSLVGVHQQLIESTTKSETILLDKSNRGVRSGCLKPAEKIEIDKLYYRYDNTTTPAVNGISITISAGDCIGFVGGTGSGKTTLIDLIAGLLSPSKGAVRWIDTTGGAINSDEWTNRLGYVSQETFLLNASITTNIILDKPLDFERLLEVSKLACLHDFVNNELPESYDTKVGENGARLSGGQKQRVAIARALYQKADVLILDEATSALDGITEKQVINGIHKSNCESIIIMIAHRISTLKECNKIYIFEHGEILDFGDFNELSKRNELFIAASLETE